MMKKSMLLSAAALTFLAISGCSTPVYEDRYAWSEGWRVGKVTKIIQADEFLKVSGSRCRQMGLGPTDQIAVIRWREVTRTRGHFARVDAGSGMAVGDEVYFNAWKCDQPPIVPKVPRGAKAGQTP